MPSAANIVYYLFHPAELRTVLQWTIWHVPPHQRDEESEAVSLRACFDFLDLTSRSFSAVIKELNHELLIPICLFYLVLRGLDTIEDDMTLPIEKKEPLLRDFYNVLDKDGWTFEDSGPNEKDRELLVHFHYVITEFNKLKPEYKKIIKTTAKTMGNGMADFAISGDMNNPGGVKTIKDYTTYCYYVAGVVGEGLTGLFVEGKSANPGLAKREDLQNSMGQFLQQTNVIRDVREDRDDNRRFWPREVWSKHVDDFDDLFKPEHREAALQCSSEMILLALERATDSLFYLAGMREQSVFNFAAIPQSMAIATLELCFRNPAIFERNVKLTKGQACRLMIDSSQNLQTLFGVFKDIARKIHKKNDPRDPNFLKISVACGKIEQFIESIFPSQDPSDVVLANAAGQAAKDAAIADAGKNAMERAEQAKKDEEARKEVMYMAFASTGVMVVLAIIMMVVATMFGARFDLAFKAIKEGGISQVAKPRAMKMVDEYVRGAPQEL